MNDQWKKFVADAYDAFGDCAPATPVRRFLRLIEAQDAVVKAAQNLQAMLEMCGSEDRDLDAVLHALAELKLE